YLGKFPDEFTNDFYENLRALLNSSLIMLAVVSKDPLGKMKQKFNVTSRFFNLGQHIYLGDFKDDDVKKLLALPCLEAHSGSDACLTTDEQNYARQWAGNHPYALALAAYSIYNLRRNGGIKEARKRFDLEISLNSGLLKNYKILKLLHNPYL
ncbi:MAG: hypothetical protein HQL73_13695, partial [Magnetococcales bacterium]|nr:hypothetical protein [Magnetococcales bacterium]